MIGGVYEDHWHCRKSKEEGKYRTTYQNSLRGSREGRKPPASEYGPRPTPAEVKTNRVYFDKEVSGEITSGITRPVFYEDHLNRIKNNLMR